METNLTLEQTAGKTSTLGFLWKIFRDPLDALSTLSREQGDIAHVNLPGRNLFLLSHPEFIEQVLVKQQSNFRKGPSLQRARIILGDGLLTSEGREHLSQRRSLQPAFFKERIQECLPLINMHALMNVSDWNDGEAIDISDQMMRLTLNINLSSFFGIGPKDAVECVGKSMKTLNEVFPLAQFPLPEIAHSLFPKIEEAKTNLDDITKKLIANPLSETSKRALINILKENRNQDFTDEQIHSHVLTFLLAGHETTALLLVWCLDMLAHHPEVQVKLQTEVDTVLGGRFPTSNDINNLPYAQMILKETLRMRPPAWALGREAVSDCEIGGQYIPAGSTVLVSQWVTHQDSRFYNNPLQFRPERWSGLDGQSLPHYAYFPFGGGIRSCIGEQFAITEAVAVLAMIARLWFVSPAQSAPAKPSASVTLRPNKSVKMIVTRRVV